MDFVSYIPAIILLILGFGLVVLEMYLPGFGAPGILGCILLVAGVVAARPTPLQALIMALIIVALLCVALSIFIHSASKGRLANSKLVLKEVATRPESENELKLLRRQDGHDRNAPAARGHRRIRRRETQRGFRGRVCGGGAAGDGRARGGQPHRSAGNAAGVNA